MWVGGVFKNSGSQAAASYVFSAACILLLQKLYQYLAESIAVGDVQLSKKTSK
jgi:hypothetical protein